jgi:hypothetical protein
MSIIYSYIEYIYIYYVYFKRWVYMQMAKICPIWCFYIFLWLLKRLKYNDARFARFPRPKCLIPWGVDHRSGMMLFPSTYGGFQNGATPSYHLIGILHDQPSILGIPHLWKPPYISPIMEKSLHFCGQRSQLRPCTLQIFLGGIGPRF